MCLNLSGFWPETPTYLEYWYLSDNFRKMCKQACVMFIPFYIFSISFIIIFFLASRQALVEGSSLSSKAWLDRRPSPLMTSTQCWTRWKNISLVMCYIIVCHERFFWRLYTFWLNQTDPRLTPLIWLGHSGLTLSPLMRCWPPVKNSTVNLKSVRMDICMYITVLKNKVQRYNHLVVNVPEKLVWG